MSDINYVNVCKIVVQVNFTTLYMFAGNQFTDTGNKATLWKNGVAIDVTSGDTFGDATCLWISDGDVYVGGIEMDHERAAIPKFWKNEVEFILPHDSRGGYVSSIIVQ